MSTPRSALSSTGLAPWVMTEMERADLAEVARVEADLYTFPWTLGNFEDSLVNSYEAWVVRAAPRRVVGGVGALWGYLLVMPAVDEAHLLNISVARPAQGKGLGLILLDKACEIAREHATRSVILEVRPSNPRAVDIYRRYGFRQIGIRRGYYPADPRNPHAREDALVLRYVLDEEGQS